MVERTQGRMPKGSFLRRWFVNSLLLAVSLGVAVLAAEGILRLITTPALSGSAHFCKDDVTRRAMRPHVRVNQDGPEWGSVQISSNGRGFRDSEWESKTGNHRVMLLGDSFAWGWGNAFDQTMGQRLEAHKDLAVYNLAIPGDGINDYYVRFNVFRHQVRPEAVVLAMYINDFFQETDSAQYAERAKRAEAVTEDAPYATQCQAYPEPRFDLLLDSYLVRRINHLRLSGGLRWTTGERQREALKAGYRPDVEALSDDAAKTRSAFDMAAHHLQRMQATGIPILVAYIPPKYQIDPAARAQLEWALGDDASRVRPEIVETRLQELCLKTGVTFLSLGEPLRQTGRTMYFEYDGHLNAGGHAVAADAIHPAVEKLLASKTSR